MFEFVRGDTFPFKFGIKSRDGTPIKKEEIKTLFITVREQPNSFSPVISQKNLDDVTIDEYGTCHVKFEPEDTEELSYQRYYFDIEITLKSGYRKSHVRDFRLTHEVTIHGKEASNGI